MSETNKILATVLALGIIGLAGLFVFYGNRGPDTQVPSAQQAAQAQPTNAVQEPTHDPASLALDTKVVDTLKSLKKGILTSSILTNEYEGAVVEVDTQGGVLEWADNFQYASYIKVQNDQGDENTFYYNEKDLSVASIEDSDGQPIDLSQIQSGDTVVIQEVLDLQEPWEDNMVSVTITRQ